MPTAGDLVKAASRKAPKSTKTKAAPPPPPPATVAELRAVVDLASRVSASYIRRPHEERAQAESYAGLIVGLGVAMANDRISARHRDEGSR